MFAYIIIANFKANFISYKTAWNFMLLPANIINKYG